MGKIIEIECTADVWIDEYVEEISDDVLLEEAISRIGLIKSTNSLKTKFMDLFIDEINLFNIISSSKNLSIVDAERLKDFLKTLD